MKNPKIGIVGYGVVGQGIHRLFRSIEIKAVYDPYQSKDYFRHIEEHVIGREKKDFKELDLVVVAVPTNTSEDGISADTSIVLDSLVWLQEIEFKGVVMIKSTTPPSIIRDLVETFSDLRIVFSPEYMGESKYFTPPWKYPDPVNMQSHTWQIFGGRKKDTSFCVDIFKRRMGVDTQFIQTDHITAALTKYMENSFFALKVTFCNEWFDIAQAYGVDFNELRECWLADPRINRNHTLVFPDDRGYGGKCFPKDVKAIINDSTKQGYKPELMTSVDQVNNKFRK